jgi:ribosomal protein S17
MNEASDKPKKTITIFVNNQPVQMEKGRVTGAEIKRAAAVPHEFKLYDQKGKQISDTEEVEIKDQEKFTAISGQDVS